jgi:hypothetical protein
MDDGHVKVIEVQGEIKPEEGTYGSMLTSGTNIFFFGGTFLQSYYDTLYSFDTGISFLFLL